MRILFDQGTPVPLRHSFAGHDVVTAFEAGWQTLTNGELLGRAEAAAFAAIVTTDKNLRYQQNLAGRRLAIVVLMTTDWRLMQRHTDRITAAVASVAPGAYVEVEFPRS